MKKIMLTTLAIFAFGFANAQSEEIKFGVKAGLNQSNFSGDADSDAKIGGYVGGLVDIPLAGNFHIQPELLFQSEGAEDASLTYARIPVMAKYYIMENLSLQAGPEFGFKIGGDDLIDDATKSIDFAFAGGAAYEFSFGLFVDARFNAGLANISEIDDVDFGTAVIQIGAGYRF
jgi:hypothetical protein